jgi:hypothetical protein
MFPFLLLLSFHFLLLSFPTCRARLELAMSITWTTSRHLDQQVVVDNGVTLTIQGDDPQNPLVLDLDDIENVGGGFKIFPEASVILKNVIITRTQNFGISIDAFSFVNEMGGSVSFTNVRCEKMSSCILRFCCGGNRVFIENSTFVNNSVALSGISYEETVSKSLFVNNDLAVAGSNWTFEDCVFLRNKVASTSQSTKFYRTLFIENDKAVNDPAGFPNPFLEDCVFYRNRMAIIPSMVKHASMYRVSFLENKVGIYCSSSLSSLDEVNFISNTEWNVVYSGFESSDVGDAIFWGSIDGQTISSKIFDSNQGSQGGAVRFNSFQTKPYLHDFLAWILKNKPTMLLDGIETHFSDWKDELDDTSINVIPSFVFSKLDEWIIIETDPNPQLNSDGKGENNFDVNQKRNSTKDATNVKPSNDYTTDGSQHNVPQKGNTALVVSLVFNVFFLVIIAALLYVYYIRPRWNRYENDEVSESKESEQSYFSEKDGWIERKVGPPGRDENIYDTISSTNEVPISRSAAYLAAKAALRRASSPSLNRAMSESKSFHMS